MTAPLCPSDCDLRGMEWMPLFGARLFSSDFEARATDAEFRAATRLWWECWQQVPAGSLPDDDAVLCKLAGLGRDLKTWKRLRAGNVLHGFVLCDDGRLYHKVIAPQAKEAWDRRVKERERKAEWRSRRSGPNGDGGSPVPRDRTGTDQSIYAGETETIPGSTLLCDAQERPRNGTHNSNTVPPQSKSSEETGQVVDITRRGGRCPTGQDTGHDADVPADRKRQDRTGQDIKEERILSEEESLPRVRGEPDPSEAGIGVLAAQEVVVSMAKAMKIRAYPLGAMPKRDVAAQIAVVGSPKARAAPVKPEELARLRHLAGIRRAG